MVETYHQLGHRYQWNIDSIQHDSAGTGIILAPRYMERSYVQGLPATLRERAIFDPQFFLPQSSQGKLNTYPFFPRVIAGGFSTSEWGGDLARRCANECLQFQVDCNFHYLVIPTRFIEGMPTSFIENQKELFVRPFIESHGEIESDKPLLLQLILTDQMLRDEDFRADLLNWATSYPELNGVYLIYHVHNRRKQIDDIDFLIGLLSFIAALKTAGMIVVVGYTNTEAILLPCAGADIVTMGSYENLRMFNTTAFEEHDETQRQGPNARVYVPRLLQWIEHQYISAIRRAVPDIDEYVEDNRHRITMFSPTYNWHFTKADPYEHFFIAFSRQLNRLATQGHGRYIDIILTECQAAMNEYNTLQSRGIVLSSDSGGNHIASWMTALNLWRRNQ